MQGCKKVRGLGYEVARKAGFGVWGNAIGAV